MNIIKVVLTLFIFVACQQNGKIEVKIENNSISNLLEKSLQQDSLEFAEWKIDDSNFLFFKAGNLIFLKSLLIFFDFQSFVLSLLSLGGNFRIFIMKQLNWFLFKTTSNLRFFY